MVYEDGGTIYQGARVTLYSDYYLSRALTSNEKVLFQWYENEEDSEVGGTQLAHQMGNNFIVDTSRIGTYYYYYVISYQVDGVITETVTSDTICVTVEDKKPGNNPLPTLLTPAEASGWRETTSSADLVDFYDTFAKKSKKRVKTLSIPLYGLKANMLN